MDSLLLGVGTGDGWGSSAKKGCFNPGLVFGKGSGK